MQTKRDISKDDRLLSPTTLVRASKGEGSSDGDPLSRMLTKQNWARETERQREREREREWIG